MPLPLALIGAGVSAAMAIPSLVRLIKDYSTPDLSDEERSKIENEITSSIEGMRADLRSRGVGDAEIEKQVRTYFDQAVQRLDDGTKSNFMDLVNVATAAVPGIGLARLGGAGIKGAFQTGAMGGSTAAGLNQVAKSAFRSGLGMGALPNGASTPFASPWQPLPTGTASPVIPMQSARDIFMAGGEQAIRAAQQPNSITLAELAARLGAR